jgi:hypothetical protein
MFGEGVNMKILYKPGGAVMLILLMIIILGTGNKVYSQIRPSDKKQIPNNCEDIRARLDFAIVSNDPVEDSFIIFIFRLGQGESSRKLTLKRMQAIKDFIQFRRPGYVNYVLAEGDKTTGSGKVEIYVKGKLNGEILIRSGESLGDECKKESY